MIAWLLIAVLLLAPERALSGDDTGQAFTVAQANVPSVKEAQVGHGTLTLIGRGFGRDKSKVVVIVDRKRQPTRVIRSIRDDMILLSGTYRIGQTVHVGRAGRISRAVTSIAARSTSNLTRNQSVIRSPSSTLDKLPSAMNEKELETFVRARKAEGKTPNQIARLLKQGRVLGDKAYRAIKKVFSKPDEFMMSLMHAVGYGLSSFAENFRNHVARGLVAWVFGNLRKAGFNTDEINFSAKSIWRLSADVTLTTWKRVGEKADIYLPSLVRTFKITGSVAASMLKRTGHTAVETVSALLASFGGKGEKVVRWMLAKGFSLNDVARGLMAKTHNNAETAALWLLKAKQKLADVIRLPAMAGQVKQITKAARRGRIEAIDIVRVLVGKGGITIKEIAGYLKIGGYNGVEAASALARAHNASMLAVIRNMKGGGYSSSQISGGIKAQFRPSGGSFTKAMRSAGYSATVIARQLKQRFNASAANTAKWLRTAGFSVNNVALALKSAYRATMAQVATALGKAGFTVNKIVDGLVKTFRVTAAQAGQVVALVGLK
jgi:hypothetical protein